MLSNDTQVIKENIYFFQFDLIVSLKLKTRNSNLNHNRLFIAIDVIQKQNNFEIAF